MIRVIGQPPLRLRLGGERRIEGSRLRTEQALGSRLGVRRTGGEPDGQFQGPPGKVRVGHHGVGQSEGERIARRQRRAERCERARAAPIARGRR